MWVSTQFWVAKTCMIVLLQLYHVMWHLIIFVYHILWSPFTKHIEQWNPTWLSPHVANIDKNANLWYCYPYKSNIKNASVTTLNIAVATCGECRQGWTTLV
jgi:hypothetical protein